MPVRSRAMQPSTTSRVLLRIDEYGHDVLSGKLYSPYLKKGVAFRDVVELVDNMDLIFDTIEFPEAAAQYRNFMSSSAAKPITGRNKPKEKEKFIGDEAITVAADAPDVFCVHVQLRQNASWQGIFTHGGSGEIRFHSTLELIKQMTEILEKEQGPMG